MKAAEIMLPPQVIHPLSLLCDIVYLVDRKGRAFDLHYALIRCLLSRQAQPPTRQPKTA